MDEVKTWYRCYYMHKEINKPHIFPKLVRDKEDFLKEISEMVDGEYKEDEFTFIHLEEEINLSLNTLTILRRGPKTIKISEELKHCSICANDEHCFPKDGVDFNYECFESKKINND
jgi:hypothetical protein